ncbi:MAG: hypothetical protein WCH44_13435 [Betaproteobacteria bacterium]
MKSVSKLGGGEVGARLLQRRAVGLSMLAAWMLPSIATFALENKPQGAIKSVVGFDTSTWAELLSRGPRPAAYVFTTTYCSTCPEVFELLHATIMAAHRKVELAAVVMDESGERALKHAHHYHGVTRIYAFDGFEPEIRQTVDPKWHNITPYVVLIGSKAALHRSVGPPQPTMLKAWLA